MRSPWVVQSVVAFTRLLLCVQGVFIAVIAWAGLFDVGPGGPPRTPNEIYALIGSVIALGSFAVAWRIGRGRWPMEP